MYPKQFNYTKASSLSEALSLISADPDGNKLLAGGHSLIPAMKLRMSTPEQTVDISSLPELKGIDDHGSFLVIRAGSTHAEIANHPAVRSKATALAESAAQIGDVQIRNFGTIGGSLAHSDPSADYPGAVLALNASVVVQGNAGRREISAEDFFVDFYTTALEVGEIIVEVRVPVDGGKSTYVKLPNQASRYPVVGCAVSAKISGGVCNEIRIGYSGTAYIPYRAKDSENALEGKQLSAENIASAGAASTNGVQLLSDVHASEAYRRAMAAKYLAEAVGSLS